MYKNFFVRDIVFCGCVSQFGGFHYTGKPDWMIRLFVESKERFRVVYDNRSITSIFCNPQEERSLANSALNYNRKV